MPLPYSPSPPNADEVVLRIMDEHVTMTRWTEYHFASDFLTPSDGWTFTVADHTLPEEQLGALKLGARVRLQINAVPVCDGHIDKIRISADRKGGVRYTIEGRDRLGLAMDGVADPQTIFNDGSTLADVLVQLFTPFGWSNRDEHYVINNDANRSAKTGEIRGAKTSRKGKPLHKFVVHQLKPYNHESVFHFASRVSQRFGLWIWPTTDGEKLVVGKPDFEQVPLFQIRRNRDGTGNVVAGDVDYDFTDQPSMIIADSFSGGGEFGKGRNKAYCINPAFGVTDDAGAVLPELKAVLEKHPDAKEVEFLKTPIFNRRTPKVPPRILYLHDDESKTQEQLENFVRREMSLLLRKSLVAKYTLEGHGQQDANDNFVLWATDTLVDVQDEIAGVHEHMYVLGVSYEKSKKAGTVTHVHLIRLHSIEFGEPPPEQPPAGVPEAPADKIRRDRIEQEQGKKK